MIRHLATLACAVALVGCAGGSDGEAPAWNHDPEDAVLGPTSWGEIDESFEQCQSGESQSPIDIDIADVVTADLAYLEFDYPATSLVVENTGHVIEASVPESSNLTLTIGDDEYRLVQFHFHAPSEHTLDGRSYEVEVHLVHESEEGKRAVVAVPLEQGGRRLIPLVDLVVESAPEDAGEEVEIEGVWRPLELIVPLDSPSAVAASYYTYRGSLTTPGCSEDVRWIMLPTLGVSRAATDRLHELIAGFPGYDGYENNNRPTQPLNDRVIQRTRF